MAATINPAGDPVLRTVRDGVIFKPPTEMPDRHDQQNTEANLRRNLAEAAQRKPKAS